MFQEILKIINSWDPIGIKNITPEDEYSFEVQEIAEFLEKNKNFNEDVRNQDIKLIPCAFLHNYDESYRNQICNPKYNEALEDAPVFLREDGTKLQDFLVQYVNKPSNK